MTKEEIGVMFMDPAPLQMVGVNCRPEQNGGGNGKPINYKLRYQTPYGEIVSKVDLLIYDEGQKLAEHEYGVLLTVVPRYETPSGQQYKHGSWFQFDITGVERMPANFGKAAPANPKAPASH
ncbi:hypothetical protein [Planctomicrobium sp. SH527]|uniref:hypothetical protein n=1 Tax=Planctomicrobium sp. SH527 TaxID=3448123 RepID=UPI003F5B6376